MRLPYLQVDGDFMNQRAKTAAGLMCCSKTTAIGHITCLWAWALAQGPDDAAPTGLVTGRWWARVLASAAEWEKDPADLVEVLSDPSVALLEVLPDGSGARIRGLARYEAAWERQRKERSRKSEWARSRRAADALQTGDGRGNDAERVGQTQIKTQTHIETTASQETVPAVSVADDIPQAADEDVLEADTRPALVLVAQPTGKPPKALSAQEQIYANLQDDRRDRCALAGKAFVDDAWKTQAKNTHFRALVKAPEKEQAAFQAAWEAYIADDWPGTLDLPWSVTVFLRQRARWESRAANGGG